MKLQALYQSLGISAESSVSEKLERLKLWFKEKLSRDLEYEGKESEQLVAYENAIQVYFYPIQPNMKLDLSELVSYGFDQLISKLKLKNEQLNQPNMNGMTLLHLAALNGHAHTTDVLLSLGALPDLLNKQKQSPLFSALFLPAEHTKKIKENKEEVFKLLQEANPQLIDQQDNYGDTVVHKMALHGFLSLLKITIAAHRNLTTKGNNQGHCPIHTAILNGQLESVLLLLSIPDAVTLPGKTNHQPIHYAAMHGNAEIINACIDAGSSLEAPDYLGKTPLLLAAETGNLMGVQALLARGAKISAQDYQGENILYYARQSNNSKLMHWLEEHYSLLMPVLFNK